ncbi:MAG: ATP-binding protein [Bdellovibrionales bacterium]
MFGIPVAFVVMAVIVILCAVCIALIWQFMKTRGHMDDFFRALDAGGCGVAIFDCTGRLQKSSPKVLLHMPFLKTGHGARLSVVLDFLYDHAVEADESLKHTLSYLKSTQDQGCFREIIETPGGDLCFVEVQTALDGDFVLKLLQVDSLKAHIDRTLKLDKINSDLFQAIEASTCAVLITDPKTDGHPVLFMNAACRALVDVIGIEAEDYALFDFFDAVGLPDSDAMLQAFTSGAFLQKEIQISRNAKSFWYDFRLTPVLNIRGTLDLCVAVFTDITMLKQKEAEIVSVQKLDALGRLSAGVAHDFNNLLSIIEGYASMIERHPGDAQKVSDYVGKIRAASKRGANLTQKMLAFSRRHVVSKELIDLKAFVFEQEALLKPLMDSFIHLEVVADDDDFFVECSSDALAQILLNLCINARDAMDGCGRIIVRISRLDGQSKPDCIPVAARSKDFVCLSVADNGGGIDPAIRDRIFDPFFTTKEQGKGTGLGLSVVYGLVQQFSGYVDVETVLSKGTCFDVYIPSSDERPDVETDRGPSLCDGACLTGHTILLVEDEPDLRDLVAHMLQGLGMVVLVAGNGDEALCVQDDYPGDIDIVLTDVVMPGMDGMKFAELFLSLRPDTPIVFMSGYPANGEMALVDLPFDAPFIAKPIDEHALFQLLLSCLRPDQDDACALFAGSKCRGRQACGASPQQTKPDLQEALQ